MHSDAMVMGTKYVHFVDTIKGFFIVSIGITADMLSKYACFGSTLHNSKKMLIFCSVASEG